MRKLFILLLLLLSFPLHAEDGFLSFADQGSIQTNKYTPNISNVLNVSDSTAYECHWYQIGNIVHVSGRVDIDPTSISSATQIGIDLPVQSNLAAIEDLNGFAIYERGVSTTAGYGASIYADTGSTRAQLEFTTATDVSNRSFTFSFDYEII